jgi:hypothetical protein
MFQFFELLSYFFKAILSLLNSTSFDIAGISVSYLDIVISLISLSIIASVFWKGARG